MEQCILFRGYSAPNIGRVMPFEIFFKLFCFWLTPPTVYIQSSWKFINSYTVMWSSSYYFEISVHQILAELCSFESFWKLFAAYCLEVIVSKFYYAPNFKEVGGAYCFWVVRPSVSSSCFLMHSITLELWMLLFWNLLYGFFMKK